MSGPNLIALLTAEFCAYGQRALLTPNFCASSVSLECLVTWSVQMHKQKNPQNSLLLQAPILLYRLLLPGHWGQHFPSCLFGFSHSSVGQSCTSQLVRPLSQKQVRHSLSAHLVRWSWVLLLTIHGLASSTEKMNSKLWMLVLQRR